MVCHGGASLSLKGWNVACEPGWSAEAGQHEHPLGLLRVNHNFQHPGQDVIPQWMHISTLINCFSLGSTVCSACG
jgi:hypothetical protein